MLKENKFQWRENRWLWVQFGRRMEGSEPWTNYSMRSMNPRGINIPNLITLGMTQLWVIMKQMLLILMAFDRLLFVSTLLDAIVIRLSHSSAIDCWSRECKQLQFISSCIASLLHHHPLHHNIGVIYWMMASRRDEKADYLRIPWRNYTLHWVCTKLACGQPLNSLNWGNVHISFWLNFLR